MVAVARDNIANAGLAGKIRVETGALEQAVPDADAMPGLVVTNPPYGERLGNREELVELHRALGAQLRHHFTGWEAALLIGEASLGNTLGIRAHRMHALFNGPLECALLRLTLEPANYRLEMPAGSARVARAQQRAADTPPSEGALMFANRLRKNLKHLGRWARRNGIGCYRLYDADMPEYAVAIDLYQADALWVHVQEYAAPATVDETRARQRLDEALSQVPGVLEVPPEQVVFKRRQRQRGTAQYERLAEAGNFIEVVEDTLRFRVNLRDYLDTGLFLDHRLTRALVGKLARGRAVLNLFAYTGTASVHAAAGGAERVLSVDMSATYCAWARHNLGINGYGLPRFEVVQADCLRWLETPRPERYGLIFLDPPTFSNSARMTGTLDIQRDHVALIRACERLLTPDGILIFSTNHRRFRLDVAALTGLRALDCSQDTLPEDFRRNARIHQCFEITRAPPG
jgi:23S rRNA (guanine2445-N2)-methyltransferase / 23S rRNA (guanine2069-N7)-methyltransferase